MLEYGVLIDVMMITNVFETDFKESVELLTSKMIFMLFSLGIVPALIMHKMHPTYRLKHFVILLVLSILICLSIVFQDFKTFSSFFRNNKDVIYRIIPNNYLYSTFKYLKSSIPHKDRETKRLSAEKGVNWKNHKKRSVFVLVIGEAARASNFSLNGYSKNTNPLLQKQNIVSYTNVSSCGTSTAYSVPCIFSSLTRNDFSIPEFKYNDNLFKLISKADFDVLWIENNSGCKGVCDQSIEMEKYLKKNVEIYDEEMLNILQKYLDKEKDLFVVLHQKGSHGPAYYLRVPDNFQKFSPICKTANLQNCDKESIRNSYDNTILYTDYFLSSLIKLLDTQKNINTAMLYVSDHGQSLGENGLYLHGMPYFIAPKYQTHIPMIVWFSKNYLEEFSLDEQCIASKKDETLSHDNVFHSVLDALEITTKNFDKKMSIFNECKKLKKDF